jgi:hypothetical protein
MDVLPELVARRARCGIVADPLPIEQYNGCFAKRLSPHSAPIRNRGE